MKKLFVTLAVLMGVSAASRVEAKDGLKIVDVKEVLTSENVDLTALAGMKFRLTFDKLQHKSYIAIKDTNGETLYSEYAKQTGAYSKAFDLSNLTDGKYTFIIINGSERIEKPFEISTNVKRSVIL